MLTPVLTDGTAPMHLIALLYASDEPGYPGGRASARQRHSNSVARGAFSCFLVPHLTLRIIY